MKTSTKITIVLATYVAMNTIVLFAVDTAFLWKAVIWTLIHFGFGVAGHILYRSKDSANNRWSEFVPTLVIGPLTMVLFMSNGPVTSKKR
jgi:hypothetical protein